MLAIQKYIKAHGLQKAVSDFSLIYKDYGHKYLLKYNQIQSPFDKQETQDCRGLVLKTDSHNVLSLGFRKFFNHGESNAADIDWDSAKTLSKEDGTFIQLYYDDIISQWCTGTTGTANGDTPVNNDPAMTFKNLFWDVIEQSISLPEFYSHLNKHWIYCFELCTPYNIVVTPHTECKIFLLGIRNKFSLKEKKFKKVLKHAKLLKQLVPTIYKLNSVEALKTTFETMPFSEEGYVVVDKNMNRIKVKNPVYVAAHHLKSKTGEHHIVEIIKQGEVEEYIATFPLRKKELIELETNYLQTIKVVNSITTHYNLVVNNINDAEEIKAMVFFIQNKCKENNLELFTPYFFKKMRGNTIELKTFINSIDPKRLYNFLKQKNEYNSRN